MEESNKQILIIAAILTIIVVGFYCLYMMFTPDTVKGQTIEQKSQSVYVFDISQLAALYNHNVQNPSEPISLFDSLRAVFVG